ncbi:MAG: glycosyl transferase, partial [Candidatus Competibacteraceae bacterium]|nr:glycosyl transferase [Candidatus Competibacteraceae bacterium]
VGAGLAELLYPSSTGILWLCLGAGTGVILISLLDDVRGVSPIYRLLAHLSSAVLLLVVLGYGDLLVLLLLLLYVVWMTNLYNFMDGMDGFAGGMALLGFGTFALLGLQAGHIPFALACALIATAAAGFLVCNFPPARIFMGDTGAATLGFLMAAFSLEAHRTDLFSLLVAVLVFSPFIVDATATLLIRLFRRERVWLPHRSHFYQRLVQLGWSQRRTVLVEYLLMIGCGLSALLVAREPLVVQGGVLALWLSLYGLLGLLVGYLERVEIKALNS